MPESTKSPAEVLGAAADLLEKPGAWTQGAFARDRMGRPQVSHDHRAICFCAVGAIYRVSGYGPTATEAISRLSSQVRRNSIGEWNDKPNRTQAEVVAALRQASRRGGEA